LKNFDKDIVIGVAKLFFAAVTLIAKWAVMITLFVYLIQRI